MPVEFKIKVDPNEIDYFLTPNLISGIERELAYWTPRANAKFIPSIWFKLADKFGWDPVTLSLSYLKYLEEEANKRDAK